MKVLHASDLHLSNKGTVGGRFLIENGINLALVDRIKAISRICEHAEANDTDLVVLPGDIFDTPNPENIAIKVAVEAIERLAEVAPVVIARGNHDGAKASEQASALAPFGSMARRFGVYVFERPDALSLIIKGSKVNLFALPYPRRHALKFDPRFKSMSPEEISGFVSRKMEEIISGFQAMIERDAVNIFVGHFTVAGSSYSREQMVPAFDVSVRSEFLDPFNLVCLGHIHQSGGYYSGTIVRNGFGEQDMKVGFRVHEIGDDRKVSTEFIELPARKYITLDTEEFVANSHIDPDTVVRVKGKVKKHVYDDIIRKMKAMNLPFLKNAVEVESETAGSNGGDVSEEPDVEQAIRMWIASRSDMEKTYEKIADKLVNTAREIEAQLHT